MENFLEILKIVLPAIISGMFTFFITKYTYNKNIPLDKMEIAYNRIYYPIYRIVCNNKDFDKVNLETIIAEISRYLIKYNKYVDNSTLRAFRLLTDKRDKEAYQNFKENIYNRNSYLRRRLGYLEPNFRQIYTYASKQEKRNFRIFIEVIIIYVCVIIGTITKDNVQLIIMSVVMIVAIIILAEISVASIQFIYCKIKST